MYVIIEFEIFRLPLIMIYSKHFKKMLTPHVVSSCLLARKMLMDLVIGVVYIIKYTHRKILQDECWFSSLVWTGPRELWLLCASLP